MFPCCVCDDDDGGGDDWGRRKRKKEKKKRKEGKRGEKNRKEEEIEETNGKVMQLGGTVLADASLSRQYSGWANVSLPSRADLSPVPQFCLAGRLSVLSE